MWTEVVRRKVQPVLALLALAGVVGCGGGGEAEAPAEVAPGATEAAEVPTTTTPAPATVAELFPEGDGREIVLNNCSSCHAVACAAMGQRNASRWQELEDAHAEHVPSLRAEDRALAFAYLAENFNDSRPEPNIPPEFIQQGCTPF